MLGQGWVSTRTPAPSLTSSPESSSSAGGNARQRSVAEPGLVGVRPGSGEIMIEPVSVCHQVSTIGHRSAADDDVVPEPCPRVDRLADASEQPQGGQVVPGRVLGPHFMQTRIAVGAV